MKTRVEELKQLLTTYDTSYRKGESLVPDSVYDVLVEELISLTSEDDEFFKSSIKEDLKSDRREALPKEVVMASMNKAKTLPEVQNWMRLKGISQYAELIISPKYDGCSLLKEEKSLKAWTRGSNNLGLKSEAQLKYMNDVTLDCKYTFGEVIISRENFQTIRDNFNGDSPRNAVAGIFNRLVVGEDLKAVDFIRYGVVDKDKTFEFKKDMFDYLNKTQKVKVPYEICTIGMLSEYYLKELFVEYSKTYEIDGLIIELNDVSLWDDLGRERNGNPKWAIAYKGSFEEVKETVCIDIEYNISKDGNIIPVAILEPVKLDGAMVSRVTLNNCSFMKELGLGISSILKVKRSGGVIPLITEVITKQPFVYPDIDCEWSGVHLKTSVVSDAQKKKQLFSFFKILGVENVSDKTFDLFYDSGFKTVKQVLEMTKEDLNSLDRFGDKKVEIVYDAIHSKITARPLPLSSLMHASGCFILLGSKKLLLVEHFESTPTFDELLNVDGFSDISANNYLNGLPLFHEFIKDLPIKYTKTIKPKAESTELDGKQFVFTGFRDKEAELLIIKKGGLIGSGVTGKTSYLVMKEKGTNSAKELKAIDLGVTILDQEDLINLLN